MMFMSKIQQKELTLADKNVWMTKTRGWKKSISINNFNQKIFGFEINIWECKLPSFATLPKISEAVKAVAGQWKRLQMTAIIALSNNNVSTNFYVYIYFILSAIAIKTTTILNDLETSQIWSLLLGSFPCPAPPHPLDLGTPTRVIALRHRCKCKTILRTHLLCSSFRYLL